VSNTFPRIRGSKRGYSVDQVEDFLEDARQAYIADPSAPVVVNSTSIRQMAFALQKGGYAPSQVDAALERLEDAFATRERERAVQELGDAAWHTEAGSVTEAILARLARPVGHRFDRVGVLSGGYDCQAVDSFAMRLTAFFQDGKTVSVEDVRMVAFRPKRGGYREAQVDLLLDAVINVMLAVR